MQVNQDPQANAAAGPGPGAAAGPGPGVVADPDAGDMEILKTANKYINWYDPPKDLKDGSIINQTKHGEIVRPALEYLFKPDGESFPEGFAYIGDQKKKLLDLIEATFVKYFANDKNKVEIVRAKHSTGNTLNDYDGSFLSQDAGPSDVVEDPRWIITPGTILDPATKTKEGDNVYYLAHRPYFQTLPHSYIQKLNLEKAIRGDIVLEYNPINDAASKQAIRQNSKGTPLPKQYELNDVYKIKIPTTMDPQVGDLRSVFTSTFDYLQRPRADPDRIADDPDLNAKFFLGNAVKNTFIRDHGNKHLDDVKRFILMKELGDTLQVEWLHYIFTMNQRQADRYAGNQAGWNADPANVLLPAESGANPIRPFEVMRANTYVATNDYVVMMRAVVNKVGVIHTYEGRTRVYTARLEDDIGRRIMIRDFINKRKNELIAQNDAVIQTILEVIGLNPQPGGQVWFDGVNWQKEINIQRAKAFLLTLVEKLRQVASDAKVFLDACDNTDLAKTKVAESQMKCPFTKTITARGELKWSILKMDNLLPQNNDNLVFRSFVFKYTTFSGDMDERRANALIELSQFGGWTTFNQMYSANLAKIKGEAPATNRNRRRGRAAARGGGHVPDAVEQKRRVGITEEMEDLLEEIDQSDIFYRYSKILKLNNEEELTPLIEQYETLLRISLENINTILEKGLVSKDKYSQRMPIFDGLYSQIRIEGINIIDKKIKIDYIFNLCVLLFYEMRSEMPSQADLDRFDEIGLGKNLEDANRLEKEISPILAEIQSVNECRIVFEESVDIEGYNGDLDYFEEKNERRGRLIGMLRDLQNQSISQTFPRMYNYEYPEIIAKNTKRNARGYPEAPNWDTFVYRNKISVNRDLIIQNSGFLYCFVREHFPEIFDFIISLKGALQLLGDTSLDDIPYDFPELYFQGDDTYRYTYDERFQSLIYDRPAVMNSIYEKTKKCIQYAHDFLKRYPNIRTENLWSFMKLAEMPIGAFGLGIESINDSIPMTRTIRPMLVDDLKKKIKAYYINAYRVNERERDFFNERRYGGFDEFLGRELSSVVGMYFSSTGYSFSDILALKRIEVYNADLYKTIFEDVQMFLVRDDTVKWIRDKIDGTVEGHFRARGIQYRLENMAGGGKAEGEEEKVDPPAAEVFEEEPFVLETPENFTKETFDEAIESFNATLEEALELSIHVYEEYYCQLVRQSYLDNNDYKTRGVLMDRKVIPKIIEILNKEDSLQPFDVVSAPTELGEREPLGVVPPRKAVSADAVLEKSEEAEEAKVLEVLEADGGPPTVSVGVLPTKPAQAAPTKNQILKTLLGIAAAGQNQAPATTTVAAPVVAKSQNSNTASEGTANTQEGGKRKTRKRRSKTA